jgi:hypothetical protein
MIFDMPSNFVVDIKGSKFDGKSTGYKKLIISLMQFTLADGRKLTLLL